MAQWVGFWAFTTMAQGPESLQAVWHRPKKKNKGKQKTVVYTNSIISIIIHGKDLNALIKSQIVRMDQRYHYTCIANLVYKNSTLNIKTYKCKVNGQGTIYHINTKQKKASVKVLVAQLCPTLCDPMDCSPPGSSVHGILHARILGWVAFLLCKIFPTWGSNPGLPVLQADSYHQSQNRKLFIQKEYTSK